MIAILTSDIDDLKATLKTMIPIDETDQVESTPVYISNMCKDSIIFANMSWQKVEIAKTIADLNAHCDLRAVIGASTTASLIPDEAKIGTLGICSNAIQYDLDFSSLGYPIGYINLLNTVILKSSHNLIRFSDIASKKCGFCAACGRFISADRFVASEEDSDCLKCKYNCQFIDSTAAPLLTTCRFYHIPAVVISGISNYADNDAVENYNHNKDAAAIASLETAITLADILSNKYKLHK